MYTRSRNTDRQGRSFSPLLIEAVWRKGAPISGHSPDVYRRDVCGAVMRRLGYGDTSSGMGWEIDHIVPVSLGGSDDLANLQPLQWQNNRSKGDNYPNWQCAV